MLAVAGILQAELCARLNVNAERQPYQANCPTRAGSTHAITAKGVWLYSTVVGRWRVVSSTYVYGTPPPPSFPHARNPNIAATEGNPGKEGGPTVDAPPATSASIRWVT